MRFNQLDLKRLVALDALLDERNVSLAAARVHLSQPAMSAALASLRDFFGDPILTASEQGMTLTEFGRKLHEPVNAVVRQLYDITKMRPKSAIEALQKNITLVASDYALHMLLPRLTLRAAQQAPGLRFEVLPVTKYQLDRFERGDVDMLIAPDLGQDAVASEFLLTESYGCIVDRDNPITEAGLDLDTYLAKTHAIARWGDAQQNIDSHALSAAGLVRNVDVIVPTIGALPAFVVGTDLIGTLPLRMAHMMAKVLPIKVLPCPAPIPPLEYHLHWNPMNICDAATEWICAELVDIARELAAEHIMLNA